MSEKKPSIAETIKWFSAIQDELLAVITQASFIPITPMKKKKIDRLLVWIEQKYRKPAHAGLNFSGYHHFTDRVSWIMVLMGVCLCFGSSVFSTIIYQGMCLIVGTFLVIAGWILTVTQGSVSYYIYHKIDWYDWIENKEVKI